MLSTATVEELGTISLPGLQFECIVRVCRSEWDGLCHAGRHRFYLLSFIDEVCRLSTVWLCCCRTPNL